MPQFPHLKTRVPRPAPGPRQAGLREREGLVNCRVSIGDLCVSAIREAFYRSQRYFSRMLSLIFTVPWTSCVTENFQGTP